MRRQQDIWFSLPQDQPFGWNTQKDVNDLQYFDFKEMDESFRAKLKQELSNVLELISAVNYNFEGKDATADTKQYHQRILSRACSDR